MIEFITQHVDLLVILTIWALVWMICFCNAESSSFQWVLFILSGPVGWAVILLIRCGIFVYDLVGNIFETIESKFFRLDEKFRMWRRRQHKSRK